MPKLQTHCSTRCLTQIKRKTAFLHIFPFFFSAAEKKKTLTNPPSQRSSVFLNRVFLSGDANVSIGKLVETFDALGYDVEFSVKPQNASGAKIEVSGSNVISFLPPIYIMKWDDNWNNNQKLEVN